MFKTKSVSSLWKSTPLAVPAIASLPFQRTRRDLSLQSTHGTHSHEWKLRTPGCLEAISILRRTSSSQAYIFLDTLESWKLFVRERFWPREPRLATRFSSTSMPGATFFTLKWTIMNLKLASIIDLYWLMWLFKLLQRVAEPDAGSEIIQKQKKPSMPCGREGWPLIPQLYFFLPLKAHAGCHSSVKRARRSPCCSATAWCNLQKSFLLVALEILHVLYVHFVSDWVSLRLTPNLATYTALMKAYTKVAP